MTDTVSSKLSAGYLVLGLTMLVVSFYTLTPDTSTSISDRTMDIFRIGCGAILLILAIMLHIQDKETTQSAAFFILAFIFIVIGLFTVYAESALILLVALAYALAGAVILLGEGRGRIVTAVALLLIAVNLVLRYCIAPTADQVFYASGLFAALSGVVAVYAGLAFADAKQRLPLR